MMRKNLIAVAVVLCGILTLALKAAGTDETAPQEPSADNRKPAQEKMSAGLLLLNVALGVLVLLLTGFAAAFSSGVPPA